MQGSKEQGVCASLADDLVAELSRSVADEQVRDQAATVARAVAAALEEPGVAADTVEQAAAMAIGDELDEVEAALDAAAKAVRAAR